MTLILLSRTTFQMKRICMKKQHQQINSMNEGLEGKSPSYALHCIHEDIGCKMNIISKSQCGVISDKKVKGMVH